MAAITLTNALMKKTAFSHKIELDALVAGVHGQFIRKDGLSREIEIVHVYTAEPNVKGLNDTLVVDGFSNGVYSDGANWYQICWTWVR